MSAILNTLRTRSFAFSVHVALWLLLYLVLRNLGGKTPEFREFNSFSAPPQSLAPIARLGPLFSKTEWPSPANGAEGSNPFFTRYFVPIPSPLPPPPTTRKIEVTYQGFFETSEAGRTAVVKLGEVFMAIPVGAPLATNFFIAAASMQSLTLTNPAAQTTVLTLNGKTEIEVPIK